MSDENLKSKARERLEEVTMEAIDIIANIARNGERESTRLSAAKGIIYYSLGSAGRYLTQNDDKIENMSDSEILKRLREKFQGDEEDSQGEEH